MQGHLNLKKIISQKIHKFFQILQIIGPACDHLGDLQVYYTLLGVFSKRTVETVGVDISDQGRCLGNLFALSTS